VLSDGAAKARPQDPRAYTALPVYLWKNGKVVAEKKTLTHAAGAFFFPCFPAIPETWKGPSEVRANYPVQG